VATSRDGADCRPFDFYNFLAKHALAVVAFSGGRYAEALDAARSAVQANQRFSAAHAVLAAALLRAGHAIEAKAAAQKVLEPEPAFSIQGANASPASSSRRCSSALPMPGARSACRNNRRATTPR
jgi:tetratricopeptide (TPR) repeat protein